MHRRLALIVALALATGAVAACNGDDGGPSGAPEPVPDVTVTTPPVTTPPVTTPPVTTPPVTSPTGAPPPATDEPAPSVDDPPATAPAPTAPSDPTAADPPAEQPSSGYPAQPDDVPWPTEEWPVELWHESEPPAGIDVARVDEVVDIAFGADDESASVRGIVVVHAGRIVYERYHPLSGPETVFDSFSVAKSVVAALAGMAVADGLVELREPTGLDEWAGDERSDITLEHLLWMASGLEWTESYLPGDDPIRMLASPRAADVPLALPLVAEPGTTFNYSTGTSAIITELIARSLGGPEELDRYVHERLIEPLGMTSVELLTDESGLFLGGLGFDATTRDFARFGLLHLRGGLWDGERLLDESWIDLARTPSPAEPGYGYHWWLDADGGAFSAQGLFGQRVTIVPDHDLVVAVNTAAGGEPGPVVDEILGQFAAAA